jgi:hypothetical protein
MKMRTVLIVSAVALLALLLAVRRPISGLYAQSQFAGATLVLDLYDDCTVGTPGCVAQRREIHTYGPDGTYSSESLWLGARAVSDPRISTIEAPNGDVTYVYGNVGEFSFWPRREVRPGRAKKPLNLSGDCVEFSTPEQSRTGKSSTVLGYRAVEFAENPGSAHSAIRNYLPELGCVLFSVSYQNSEHRVTVVPVQITPTYDSMKLAMHPAGLAEKSPAEVEHDAMARSLALQGYSQERIDKTWQETYVHDRLDVMETSWKESRK